jgi:toxin ParE1/3/4
MSENNRKILRSPEAQEDLLSIWQFGADEWSPEQADEHLRDIEDMCDRLRVHPELGRKRDALIVGLYSIPVSPHIIFYQQSPKAITIVRVLHEALDTPQHFRQ